LLSDLPKHLHRADIVITSTASPLPFIGKGAVERALKLRKHKPMFMVDIAVPRDIEPEVAQLSDIFLYTVDDLTEVVDENKKSREQAARIAEEIIEEGVKQFLQGQQAMQAVEAIRQFRDHVGELTADELSKALRSLRAGQEPEQVLERFAHTLSKKFMHEPTSQLKRAAIENDLEFVRQIEKLYSVQNDKP
jgi:glutamyl-tRNA reductase